MERPRCPKCGLRLPRIDQLIARCPVCDALIRVEIHDPRPAPPRPTEKTRTWPTNLARLAAFVACAYVWVKIEISNTEPVNIPRPVEIPRLPEFVTHPDASPEECARVRAAGGECASFTTLRTCDDSGVMTEELCGLGAWPCIRDGCGSGARCCVPGTFDAALGQSPEDTLVDTANTKTPSATTTTGSTSVMPPR